SRLRKETSFPVHVDLDATEVTITEQASPRPAGQLQSPVQRPLDGPAEVYAALVTGTRDYVHKSGKFQEVVLGLSGGIDSSLTACVAVDALGRENVIGAVMPSRYTTHESLVDAGQLAEALGIRTYELPIEQLHEAFSHTLAPHFAGRPPDLTE